MIDLLHGDCLEIMPTLPAQSFDAIIADIPYGTTACSWDTVIPFAPMWAELKRLAKPRAAIVLFGSQPFTSALVMSNPQMFRYEWVWEKEKPTNFLQLKKRVGKTTENICVFYSSQCNYNPQMSQRVGKPVTTKPKGNIGVLCDSGAKKVLPYVDNGLRYPTQVIRVNKEANGTTLHPTQKPVALMEYLIKTYTNEGDTVLDFTMGSGTTMVAAVNTKRNGVGIELRKDYYNIAQRRVQEAQQQMVLI